MNIQSYHLLKEISSSLQQSIECEEENRIKLKNAFPLLAASLCDDFFEVTAEKLIIDKLYTYYNDVCYRQSSTGCIVKTHFESNPTLLLSFECLIDYNKIMLRIKGDSPTNDKLFHLKKKIEKNYSIEGLTEFKELLKYRLNLCDVEKNRLTLLYEHFNRFFSQLKTLFLSFLLK